MKVILVRHGETEENTRGVFIGHLPGKLTEKGIQQARDAAERLKEENLSFIYSSDLDRAKHTAEFISKFHECPFNLTEKLRERNYGELTGKTKAEIDMSPTISGMTLETKEGETHFEIFNRAKDLLKELFEKHEDENILLVSHGGFIKSLLAVTKGKSIADLKDSFTMKNAEEVRLDVSREMLK